MKLFFSKIYHYLRKRKYRAILQDREDLSDYEKKFLVPEIKLRLRQLKEYFQAIVNLCEAHKTDPLFAAQLEKIVNPADTPYRDQQGSNHAEQFFSQTQKLAKEQHTDEIDKILLNYSDIDDLKRLVAFLNEVNFLCSSLVEVNNRLFLFHLQTFPHVIDPVSGKVLSEEPRELHLTTKPFEITVNNIVSVSKATSDTIHTWHKEFMEGKRRFLEYYGHKISLRNNRVILFIQLFALLLGVALSALFLFANDPFNQFKKNQILEQRNLSLQSEITQCKQDQIEMIRKKDECKTQLQNSAAKNWSQSSPIIRVLERSANVD